MHPVVSAAQSLQAKPSKEGNRVIADEDGQPIEIGKTRITGDQIKRAEAGVPQNQVQWVVNLDFDGDGGKDRESVRRGKSVSVRVELGGRGIMKQKTYTKTRVDTQVLKPYTKI